MQLQYDIYYPHPDNPAGVNVDSDEKDRIRHVWKRAKEEEGSKLADLVGKEFPTFYMVFLSRCSLCRHSLTTKTALRPALGPLQYSTLSQPRMVEAT